MSEPLRDSPLSDDGSWRWNGSQWVPNMPSFEQETVAVLTPNSSGQLLDGLGQLDFESVPDFSGDAAVAGIPASTGMRGLIYRATGHDAGISKAELYQRQLAQQVRTPILDAPARIAVATAKGGSGKTTISLLVTSRLALDRHERALYLEANPHHGTARTRTKLNHKRSVVDLLDYLRGMGGPERDIEVGIQTIHSYTTLVSELGMEVLTAPMDPALSKALGEQEYRRILRLLYRFYPILTLDLGTGLLDPATMYMLSICDQAVIVAGPSADIAQLAVFTSQFLEQRRGRDWLRDRAIVVINNPPLASPRTSFRDRITGKQRKAQELTKTHLIRYFTPRVRNICEVSFDPHISDGTTLNWDKISSATRQDLLALSAEVASGFDRGFSQDALPSTEQAKLFEVAAQATAGAV